MNISIDCRMLGSGGIGSYLAALLPLFMQNNKCLLIGKEDDIKPYGNSKNVELEYCDIDPFSFADTFLFPRESLAKINETDVFYSPYCNIPSGIKIPIYSTIHDVVFLDIPDLAGTLGTLGRKFFYKRAISKSTKIFTVSEFSKERIVHHLKPGKKEIVVTYNALPPWFAEDIPENFDKQDYILFVGNIKKHKGLHTLIQAYKICLDKGFSGKLLIVGNADNFRTNDDTISNEIANLKDYVEFTGRISDKQLKEAYYKAKLLIQPSLYEGFGMPPLEAISLGTNAVISDIPVFKEIYENLPVTFFEKENFNDLADKILNTYNMNSPAIQECPYSFERTYKIIMENIGK